MTYLLSVQMDALKALEAQFVGTEIVDGLKTGEFVAPVYLQDRLEQQIRTLATLCAPLAFEIEDGAYRLTTHEHPSKLVNIARQHQCYLEIQTRVESRICQIPKAATEDHVSNTLTAAAIDVRLEDLSEQKVRLCRHNEFVSLPGNNLGRSGRGFYNIGISSRRHCDEGGSIGEARVCNDRQEFTAGSS